jgi:hypothetical protein
MTAENMPFRDREDVRAEVRRCGFVDGLSQYLCFLFAALGVIGDASNVTLDLESMSWSLLAIVLCLNAVICHTHVVVGKHLLGVGAEGKKQE